MKMKLHVVKTIIFHYNCKYSHVMSSSFVENRRKTSEMKRVMSHYSTFLFAHRLTRFLLLLHDRQLVASLKAIISKKKKKNLVCAQLSVESLTRVASSSTSFFTSSRVHSSFKAFNCDRMRNVPCEHTAAESIDWAVIISKPNHINFFFLLVLVVACECNLILWQQIYETSGRCLSIHKSRHLTHGSVSQFNYWFESEHKAMVTMLQTQLVRHKMLDWSPMSPIKIEVCNSFTKLKNTWGLRGTGWRKLNCDVSEMAWK